MLDNVNIEPFTKFSLNVLCWNINNYCSRVFGNKLLDPDFLKVTHGYDVVGLVETHSKPNDDLYITGFGKPFVKLRPMIKKKKAFGGISVFIKQEIIESLKITQISTPCQDILWLKFDNKDKATQSTPFLIGFVYISPEHKGNKSAPNPLEVIREDCLKMAQVGDIILMGDMNARLNNLSDFIETNSSCDEFPVTEIYEGDREAYRKKYFDPLTSETLRVSQDSGKVNKRGKQLIKLCKACDLRILNGRKIGDAKGKVTCFRWNGCSVVDYAICSANLYDNITYFEIKDHMPWMSDHSPIGLQLSYAYETSCAKLNEKLEKLPKRYKWNEKTEKSFEHHLQTDYFSDQITKIGQSPDQYTALKFKILVSEAAKLSGVDEVTPNAGKKSLKSNKPWFDHECSEAKKDLCVVVKQRIANPQNKQVQIKFNERSRYFKNLVRRKKYNFYHETTNKLASGNKNTFWQTMNKMRNTQVPDSVTNMAPHKIFEHFSNLLHNKEQPEKIPKCQETGILDSDVVRSEVDNALKTMNNASSPGLDSVTISMLRTVNKVHPTFFANFFTGILKSGQYPKAWSCALLIPIHKKGSREELTNYRGISILSSTSKLFCTILNTRLTTWAIENNKLSQGQLGFIRGNRTSDAHIILNNLTSRYCHKKSKPFFACFVDLEKAFDKLPRDLLLKKLLNMGINGSFLNVINTMYTNDYIKVRVGDRMTKEIAVNQGVRQGCVLSPILFNLFLSDFQSTLEKQSDTWPVFIDEHTKLHCILWADDIVLLSEKRTGMQNQINLLHDYCSCNKVSVNVSKTSCISFNKSGQLINNAFHYNNYILEDKIKIKYLGFYICANGSIRQGLEDLSDRAQNAFFKLKSCLNSAFRQNIRVTLQLFDSIIKPILLYASDFWGMHKINSVLQNPCEIAHTNMCKQLLGVAQNTAAAGVLIELGRVPISLQGKRLCLDNWLRILGEGKSNKLLELSCRNAMKENLIWAQGVLENLDYAGMEIIAKNASLHKSKSKITNIFTSFMQNKFIADTRNNMSLRSSKLNYLNSAKTDNKTSEYLMTVTNINHRIAMTKLRLSSHSLRIETGRYTGVARGDRICPFPLCNEVEDEKHFLIRCSQYESLRKEFFTKVNQIHPYFSRLDDDKKFYFLFKCHNSIVRTTSKFAYQAFLIRNENNP